MAGRGAPSYGEAILWVVGLLHYLEKLFLAAGGIASLFVDLVSVVRASEPFSVRRGGRSTNKLF